MQLAEVAEGTPRVLKQYLKVFESPSSQIQEDSQRLHSAPVTPTKYESHPEIQFFRLVKTKHHYAYHKSKLSLSSAEQKSNHMSSKNLGFEPFDRDQLLDRLKTFNALNWQVPAGKNPGIQLNELLCASYGWVCQSVARSRISKNHLKCTKCGSELILRFNAEEEQPEFAPFHFDLEDIQAVNLNLKAQYTHQVQSIGHSTSCPWTKVLTPIDTVYYLTPYLASTNAQLIKQYTKNLRSLFDNFAILQEHAGFLSRLSPISSRLHNAPEFCRISNEWLLSTYYSSDKENVGTILSKTCPLWLYFVAAMGWDLFTQDFNGQTVLLMICQSCNQRIFLEKSSTTGRGTAGDDNQPKALTPCQYTATISNGVLNFSNEYLDEVIEDENEDPFFVHKLWCCQVREMAGQSYLQYFVSMILSLEDYIGPKGEYLTDRDDTFDMEVDVTPKISKRKASFDLQEELEKFKRLRKPYFAE